MAGHHCRISAYSNGASAAVAAAEGVAVAEAEGAAVAEAAYDASRY